MQFIEKAMILTLDLPDDIAQALAAHGDLSLRALEGFALEEFRAARLSQAELRRLLGLSRYELDGFLKAHDELIDYPVEEFERQRQALRESGF
jgi:hypothetical protein